jgi:hypothetical protein
MLRVLLALLAVSAASATLCARFYDNAMLLGKPKCSLPSIDPLLNITDASHLPCPGMKWGLTSVRFDGMFVGGEIGQDYEFAVNTNGRTRFWIHAWKMVDVWVTPGATNQLTGIWNFTKTAGVNYPVRLEFQVDLQETKSAVVQILWRKTGTTQFIPLPDSALIPTVLPAELQRQSMQAGLARGWNTWHRASAMAHVHLPTGFGVQLALVDAQTQGKKTSWNAVDKCLMEEDCKIRPGRHTLNGSFTEITGRLRGKADPTPLNVTISTAHLDASGDSVVILLQANNTEVDPDISVLVSPSWYFDCGDYCGNITVTGIGPAAAVQVQPAGFAPMRLAAVGSGQRASTTDKDGQSMTVGFTGGLACLVASPMTVGVTARMSYANANLPSTTAECQKLVEQGQAAYDAELEKRYPRANAGGKRDVIEAIRSVMGWNTMYV